MNPKPDIPSTELLPAIPDDLLALVPTAGAPQALRLSPALAALTGVEETSAPGRPLERLFAGCLPAPVELVQEVAQQELPLRGVQLRFPGGATRIADLVPAGADPQRRGRLVALRLRRPGATQPLPATVSGLVGDSAAMREVLRKIALYAPAEAAVVITGETGTGKELVARALHDASPRRHDPYVAVNCSAISEELLESELFGHEKGAFTGAIRSHRGRFERADGGTLFLDEIGDMPLHTQVKLLRVLETGSIERVGAEQERHIDVRVVAATNLPLEQAVGDGRFRADLYHRLSVLRLHLPPLRERSEDLPLLVAHFLQTFARKYGRSVSRLTDEALTLLQSYLWPGNVRELRNVLERVFIENRAEVIGARAFRDWIRERRDFTPGGWGPTPVTPPAIAPPYPLASTQRLLGTLPADTGRRRASTRPADLDAEEIRRALQASSGNLSAAARLLGVHRATLYRYLERLGLSRTQLTDGATGSTLDRDPDSP